MTDLSASVIAVCLLLAISVLAVVVSLFFGRKRSARAGLIPVLIPGALLPSVLAGTGGLIAVIQGFRRMANEESGDLESVVGFTYEGIEMGTFGASISLVILLICLAVFVVLLRGRRVVPQTEHPAARTYSRILVGLSLIPATLGFAALLAGNWASITPMSVVVTDPPEGPVTTYVLSAGFDENESVDVVSAKFANNLVLAAYALGVLVVVFPVLAIISEFIGRGTAFTIGFVRTELVIVLFICLFLAGYLMWLDAQLSWLSAVLGSSSNGP